MKRRQILLAAAGGPLYLSLDAAHAATTWKLASGYKADTLHGRNLTQFARDVQTATSGRLNIELMPNNTFVPMSDIPAGVRDGRIEAGEVIMTTMVKEMPIAGADAVPFVTRTYESAARLWQYQRPVVERNFATMGMQLLFAAPWPPQGLYTKKPVTRSQDFKGLKMRVYNPTTKRIAELLEAVPVDVANPDIERASAEGRIECMITSASTGVASKVWDYYKYFYEINAWYPKNMVFVNSKALAALPKEDRDVLLAMSAKAEQRGWERSQIEAREAANELRKHGMSIEPPPPLLSPQLRQFGDKFSLEWIRQVGQDANDVFLPFFTKK